jgi:hypothetical protein
MKVYFILILFISFNYIFSASYCNGNESPSPSKAEDCNKANQNGGYCCLVKGKGKNYCDDFSPNQYKAIPEYVKLYKKCTIDLTSTTQTDCVEYKDYSIECKSSYLAVSLLALIILIL